jgi:DNA-directed RNA polymerase omega subunit
MQRKKTINELAEEVGGMYALVVGVAKRAKQLKEGRARVVDCPSANVLTVAMQELQEGKVIVRPAAEGEEPAEPQVAPAAATKAQPQPEAVEAEAPKDEAPTDEAAADEQ